MLVRFICCLICLTSHTFVFGDQNSALIIEYSHNPYGWPALHYATLKGRSDIAMMILDLYPEQAKQSTPSIPLMDSHFGNNADQDYDYFTGNYEDGTSSLELAVRFGDEELVRKLLALGANPSQVRLEWVNVDQNDPYRIRHEWQPYLADNWEPRRQPRVYGHFKFAWTRDWDSRSILYWALLRNNSEIVDLLLEAKASLLSCYSSHRQFRRQYAEDRTQNAFQVALQMGNDLFFTKLLAYQAGQEDLSDDDVALAKECIQNPHGIPPLAYALYTNDTHAFSKLLHLGFDPKSVLTTASQHNNRQFLDQLLAYYPYADMALELAINTNNVDLAGRILEQSTPAKDSILKATSIEMVELLTRYIKSEPTDLLNAIEHHKEAIFFYLLAHTSVDERHFRASIVHNEPKMFEALYNTSLPTDDELISYKKLAIEVGNSEILSFLCD